MTCLGPQTGRSESLVPGRWVLPGDCAQRLCPQSSPLLRGSHHLLSTALNPGGILAFSSSLPSSISTRVAPTPGSLHLGLRFVRGPTFDLPCGAGQGLGRLGRASSFSPIPVSWVCVRAHVLMRAHAHTHTCMHALMHTHVHLPTYTNAHTHSCTHTFMH